MTEMDGIPGQVFASVWDALEDSPAEAANMRLRSELMVAVKQAVAGWGVTQAEALEQYIARHSPLKVRLDDRWVEKPGAPQAPYLAKPYLEGS